MDDGGVLVSAGHRGTHERLLSLAGSRKGFKVVKPGMDVNFTVVCKFYGTIPTGGSCMRLR